MRLTFSRWCGALAASLFLSAVGFLSAASPDKEPTGLASNQAAHDAQAPPKGAAPEARPTNDPAASPEAASLVRQALEAEVNGDDRARSELLRKAVNADPNYAPAHWHSGEVRNGEQWLSADAAAAENRWSGKWAAYRQARATFPMTGEAQLKLARWCADAGLKDQEKLHLQAVLQSRATRGQRHEAIGKLGLVRYQKNLMTAEQAQALKQQAREAETAMLEWRPRLNRLREDLESRDTARQDSARTQLSATTDKGAILPIETVFAKAKPEAGCAAVAAIAGIKQQAATDSLVRHAVFAQHEEVRKAAAEALKSRDVFSYVPMLLSSMGTPIEISFNAFAYEGGAFGERLTLFREGPLYSMAFTSGTMARTNATPTPGGVTIAHPEAVAPIVALRAAGDAVIATAARSENARVEAMNSRIAETLRTATGNETLEDDARQWWDWWTAYNESHYASDKPTYEINRTALVYYPSTSYVPMPEPVKSTSEPAKPTGPWHSDRVTTPYWLWGPNGVPGHSSCFVAGTLVWTNLGPLPIEMVQVGDWVLSQDVDSGELTYKPVSATTLGKPLPLVELRIGEETIRSTHGHLFWVVGEGWVMAKNLVAGQRLHTAQGAVTLDSVEMNGEAVCHNLIVPDFATYFVTDKQLLVHDVDIRGPTTSIVPGMPAP